MEMVVENNFEKPLSKTQKQFRRQSRLQITLPFGIGILVIIILGVVIWSSSYGSASTWADASLIFLIIPAMIFGLIFLGILGGLAYAIFRLIDLIPGPAQKIREFMELIAFRSRRGSESISRIILLPAASVAAFEAGWHSILSVFRKDQG
jgi:hypothetical protein